MPSGQRNLGPRIDANGLIDGNPYTHHDGDEYNEPYTDQHLER